MSAAAPEADQRAAIEDLVCDLPGAREGELSFEYPWQIRAFALAVVAHQNGKYEWTQFQGALIASIQEWETSVGDLSDESWSYYQHWVTALEQVLAEKGTLSTDEFEKKTAEVLATPANRNHHHAVLEPIAIDKATAS
ncbi:nitrile hydratase accessory protein [Gordonia polyisoprenivorans]|uniref:nitrile hydratase accessory protein n=1 Tax=Gordonia polyisoprenivorans TaxID=84595 RepID=UPI001AD75CD3|nr:nitrile hydratase accessory protein [Gordonia polyisoprenivorans]QTI69080.1 nitrile hydratase accessory protein [Gordonia polyisoprenivorans]